MRSSVVLLSMVLLQSGTATGQQFSAGPYLRASGSVAFENFEIFLDPPNPGPEVGFNGSLGYRFLPYLALEVEGEWVDTFRFVVFDTPFVHARDDVDIWVTTLNAKVLCPIGRVHPFVGGGIGAMHESSSVRVASKVFPFNSGTSHGSATDFAGRVVAGVEVYVVGGLAVVVDGSYVFGTGDVDGFDYGRVGWGLQYRF